MRKLLAIGLLLSLGLNNAVAGSNYVVGVEALNYYPHYSDGGKTYSGFARELLDAFAQSKGYSFEYKILPVARLYESFFAGDLDFKYPDSRLRQESKRKGLGIDYSDLVVSHTDGVFVLPANKGKEVSALKSLGTVRGFTLWDYLGLVESGQVKVQKVNSFQQSLLQGVNARVDGVYMEAEIWRCHINNVLKLPGALVFDDVLPSVKWCDTLTRAKNANVIADFNQFFVAHATEVAALKVKYGLR